MKIKKLVHQELKKKNGKTEMVAELAPGVILVGESTKVRNEVLVKESCGHEEKCQRASCYKPKIIFEKRVSWEVWFDPKVWKVLPFVGAEVSDLLKGGKVKRFTIVVPDVAYGIPSIVSQVWTSLVMVHTTPWRYWYKQPKIIGLQSVLRVAKKKRLFRIFYYLAELLRLR